MRLMTLLNKDSQITSNYYGLYNPYPANVRARGEIFDGGIFYIDNFKLRDISAESNLNQTTGITCKTAFKKKILPVAISLDIYSEQELDNKLNMRGKLKQAIISEIRKIQEKELDPWKYNQLNDLDRYTLLKLLYFAKLKKPALCKELYQWYKDNNLLVINVR